jgi:hypothetical protein
MSQIRGTAGYNLSNQNQFGGPSRDITSDPSPLDAIREQTSKIEDFLDTLSDPVKPYVLHLPKTPRRKLHDNCPSANSDSRHEDSVELLLTFLLRRYLPAIGRFLIVVTFLEDALRIITQWSDQLLYLHDYRHSMAFRSLLRDTKLID